MIQYKRILLKLSGEALLGRGDYGIDVAGAEEVLLQVREVKELGVEIAIVVGGGNIFRGGAGEKEGIDRVTGDYMGMLATVINAFVLKSILEKLGVSATVQTALRIERMAEPFDREKAREHLEKGTIVIFACGTGNPYFTTDTAAALRAIEIGAEVLLKATKVDGVYDRDPKAYADATFFPEISYANAIDRRLNVMDLTAITLCMEHNLPIVVFNMKGGDNMRRIVQGEHIGTIVRR